MIQANELRCGNWLNFFLGEKQVDYLDIRDIAEGRLIKEAEPIPLTEDWMNKLGFIGIRHTPRCIRRYLSVEVFLKPIPNGSPLHGVCL